MCFSGKILVSFRIPISDSDEKLSDFNKMRPLRNNRYTMTFVYLLEGPAPSGPKTFRNFADDIPPWRDRPSKAVGISRELPFRRGP